MPLFIGQRLTGGRVHTFREQMHERMRAYEFVLFSSDAFVALAATRSVASPPTRTHARSLFHPDLSRALSPSLPLSRTLYRADRRPKATTLSCVDVP